MNRKITIKYLQEYIKVIDFHPDLTKGYFLKLSKEVDELSRAMRKNLRPPDTNQIMENFEEEV